ncbi:MAG: efflux RND transporter periplasmic adaptor subunit [Granulosicoccus sp.]
MPLNKEKQPTRLRQAIRFTLPLFVLGVALGIAHSLRNNEPDVVQMPTPVNTLRVEATRVKATEYPVFIKSQGFVQPTLFGTLVPEVSGKVTFLAADLVIGGSFDQGELLLQIDPRDYAIALTQATANLAQAEAQLEEQTALAERAVADWQSFGSGASPSALTLREPQLAAARANLDAALAQLERARLDLERTRLTAPYQGMVLDRPIDQGQFLSPGTSVARIYSTDTMDVRLPLSNRQLSHLRLPITAAYQPAVELTARVGRNDYTWTGKLVHTEGIDSSTQQMTVIARIEQPLTQQTMPLRVGQFVEAAIAGSVLSPVFVIPLSALRENREVLLIDSAQTIRRQSVVVAWSDEQVAVLESGLDEGNLLVTTPLSSIADGTPVQASIDGVAPADVKDVSVEGMPEQRIN